MAENARDESPKQDLPEFTLRNLLKDVIQGIKALLFNPEMKSAVIPALMMFEMIATKLIRLKVPYTEIDYKAYVEQIEIIKSGELNYSLIYGGTGPLVYPAGHVWIYRFMNWATDGMNDVATGQVLFGYLYLLTEGLVFIIYANLDLQPWVLYLLVLSKRLHSIYILRLFNDCFTTLFIVLTVLFLQLASKWKNSRRCLSKYLTNLFAPLMFGLAISVKMNALLYFPGFILVTYFLNDEVLLAEVAPLSIVGLVQVVTGYEFLYNGPEIREAYLANAFDFKRKFLYEWTVNWKFLSEDLFSSDEFHQLLLAVHAFLILFFLFTKWTTLKITGKSIVSLVIDGFLFYKPTLKESHIINNPKLGPRYVVSVLISCNYIGILVARSLHYQFLSWYAWTLPFLLYHSSFNFAFSMTLYLIHEYCWNVYPSTALSSTLLVGINCFVLVGYWLDDSLYSLPEQTREKKDK